MKHTKHNLRSGLVVLGAILTLCGWIASVQSGQQGQPRFAKLQRFALSTTVMEPTVGLIRMERKGEIRWLEQDPNGWRFEIKLEQIKVQTVNLEVKKNVEKIKPFTAIITVSKKEEAVPLSIEIIEGKVDDKKCPGGLGGQYETACKVSEMMLATALSKQFEVSEQGKSTTVKIDYPKQLKCEFGVRDARLYGCSRSADEFSVFPHIDSGQATGSDLFSFSHSQGTTSYCYRMLDRVAGMATHAVNLRATMREDKQKGDYTPLIEIIGNPEKFYSYELNELKITGAE